MTPEIDKATVRAVLARAERLYMDSPEDEDSGVFLDRLFREFGFDPNEFLNEEYDR